MFVRGHTRVKGEKPEKPDEWRRYKFGKHVSLSRPLGEHSLWSLRVGSHVWWWGRA